MIIVVGFSGHRDCVVDIRELDNIREQFKDAIWEHGGAADGFDRQVDLYCDEHNIKKVVVRPEYNKYEYKYAPLVRNRKIVDDCYVLVVCYDGRKKGGTFSTINYAKNKRRIIYLKPKRNSA